MSFTDTYADEPEVTEAAEPYVPPAPEPEPAPAEAKRRVLYDDADEEPPPPPVADTQPQPQPQQYAQANIATGIATDAAPEQAPAPAPTAKKRRLYYDDDEEAPAGKKRVLYEDEDPESPLMTFGREFAHGAPAAVTGAVVGAGTGAALTSWGGPIAFGGALAGGIVGGIAGEVTKDKLLTAAGYNDEAQRAANKQANPWSARAGSFGSQILGGSATGAKIAARGLSGLIAGGWEAGSQLYHGQPLSYEDIMTPAAGGVVFAGSKRPWNQGAERVGGRVGARFGTPAPEVQPTIPGTPPVDVAAPVPPAQGALPFSSRQTPYDVKSGTTTDPKTQQQVFAGPDVRPPPQPEIGGGEAQPALPFGDPQKLAPAQEVRQRGVRNEDWTGPPAPPLLDRPSPPPQPQQRSLALEPPTPVTPEGQYGFGLEAPQGGGLPRTRYEDGKWITQTASRSAMPDGAGSAKEAVPPPSAPPAREPPIPQGEPPAPGTPGAAAHAVGAVERAAWERQQAAQARQVEPPPQAPPDPWGWQGPHSTVTRGQAEIGPGPQAAAGIHVLQPGQVDPTLQHAAAYPAPQRTIFEPPRPPGPPPEPGPAPLPRDRSLAIRPPDTTQGVTEPPVPTGSTRMYQGPGMPPNAFTTNRRAAEQGGQARFVDVRNQQDMPFFTPGRDGTFTTRNESFGQRTKPVQEVRTEPTGRGGEPPPAAPAAPAAPAKGGPPPEAPAGGKPPTGAGMAPPELEAKLKAAQTAEQPPPVPAATAAQVVSTGKPAVPPKAAAAIATSKAASATSPGSLQSGSARPSTDYRGPLRADISAADYTARMAEMRDNKPRPVNKLWNDPSKAPPEQVAAAKKAIALWNAEYARVSKNQKAALARDNAAFQAKQQAPAAPAPAASAAPTAPAAPKVNAPNQVTLLKDAHGEIKVDAVSHHTYREMLAKYAPKEGLLADLTEHVRSVMLRMIGNMPVSVVSKSELAKYGQDTNIGVYNRQQNHIIINEAYLGKPDAMAHAIFHEGVHAVTAHALHQVPAVKNAVNQIMRDVLKQEMAARAAAGHTTFDPKTYYGFFGVKDPELHFLNGREFIAEAFSNPHFQEMLKRYDLSPDVTKAIQAYIGKHTPAKSAWDGFVQTVRQILNIPPGKINALEAVMRTTEHAMSTNEQAKTAYMKSEGTKYEDYSSIDAMAGKGEKPPIKATRPDWDSETRQTVLWEMKPNGTMEQHAFPGTKEGHDAAWALHDKLNEGELGPRTNRELEEPKTESLRDQTDAVAGKEEESPARERKLSDAIELGPKGSSGGNQDSVRAYDRAGNEKVFTGSDVHAAAAAAKAAGHQPYQIYNMDMTKYKPSQRSATTGPVIPAALKQPAANASAATKAASAKTAATAVAPPPGSKTPPTPLGGSPFPAHGAALAARQQAQEGTFRAAVDKIADTYKRTFDPARISEGALKGQAPARESRAYFEGEQTRITRAGVEAEAMWRKVPDAERLKALDDYENGRPIDPKYAAYFKDRFGPEMDRAHKEEKQEGSRADYIQNYVAHEWNRPKPGQQSISDFFAKTMGPAWFQKARTIDFIREGMRAGYTLRNTNPEALLRSRLIAGADMRSKARLLNDWQDMGLSAKSPDAAVTKSLERMGWTELNGPDRAKWMIAPDVQTIWKNGIEAKGMWASDSIGGDVFRGWMAFKAAWVPLKLAASAFHALHVAHINMNTNLARAITQASSGDSAGAYKSLGKIFEVKSQTGIMGREQWALPEHMRTQEGKDAVRTMEEGGFVPMMNEEMQTSAQRDFRKAIDDKSIFKTPIHGLRYAIQKVQAPLFEHWIPHLKTAAYLNDAAALFQRRPDLLADPVNRKVALTEIAKSIDNRFGEMFYGGLFWNRYVKDVSIGSFLSLGWNLGFAREFGGAAIEAVSRPAQKFIPGLEAHATRKVAQDATNKIAFATSYMATAAVFGGAMTWMLTGKPPEDVNDYIFPRVGGENPDGSPRRLSTMFYTREIPMLMKHVQEHGGGVGGFFAGAKDMIWNKMLFQPVKELYDNRSYFGKEIYDTNAPDWKKFMQAGQHVFGEQFNPMSVSGAKRAVDTGGDPAKEVPLAFLGFGPAPKYAEASAMQNRIGHLFREHVAPGARAYEDEADTKAKLQARNDILMAVKKGDDTATSAAIDRGVAAGMKPAYIKSLIKGEAGDQKMFKRLPKTDQIHLLNSGTKQEVERYLPFASKETKQLWYGKHPPE